MAAHQGTLSSLWGSLSQPSTSTGTESLSQSESVGEHGTETSGQGGRFDSSETESDRDDCISSHSEQNCPPLRKKRKQSRLSYQQDWKWKYLMLPAPSRDGKSANDNMICAQCQQHMKAKSSTALRHYLDDFLLVGLPDTSACTQARWRHV